MQWLVKIAERNELMLVAELLELCASDGKVDRMIEILSNPEYANQNNTLSALCQEQDLSKALQAMVSRRLFTNKHRDLEQLESDIHTQIEVFVSSSDMPEVSQMQLHQELVKSHHALVDKITNCSQLLAQAEAKQTLSDYREPLADDETPSSKI
ncbi:MAG: hypothetical protein QNK11_07420 [Legionella sp.]|nr:hypothetical protein [Legionella sp.]